MSAIQALTDSRLDRRLLGISGCYSVLPAPTRCPERRRVYVVHCLGTETATWAGAEPIGVYVPLDHSYARSYTASFADRMGCKILQQTAVELLIYALAQPQIKPRNRLWHGSSVPAS